MKRRIRITDSGRMATAFFRNTIKNGEMPKVYFMPVWKGRALFKRAKRGTWRLSKYGATCEPAPFKCTRRRMNSDGTRVWLSTGEYQVFKYLLPQMNVARRSTLQPSWLMGMQPL